MGMARGARVWMAIALCLGMAGSALGAPPDLSTRPPAAATGQRISLDLKGVDILDVLKLFSQKSGLNFVAGRNVTGRITIFVNDVNVWDAFELIIGANDLAFEQRGDIVTVMTARDYELIYGEGFQARTINLVQPLRYAKAIQVATVLNQLKSAVGRVVADEASNTLIIEDVPSRLEDMQQLLATLDQPTITRVYTLNYAEAEQLEEKVQELLSPVGTYTFDTRTNKAIISDLPEVLQKTDEVIRAFDTPEGQVLIEAKIVSVDLTDQMDLGIDWERVLSGIDTTVRSNFRVLGDIVGAGTATGSALSYLSSSGDSKIIIEALKTITNTETISSPRVLVSNNQEAKFFVATREAIVTTTTTVPATGSTVAAPEIQFVDVGTKLFVTPNVKSDGHIQLQIRPEISTSTVVTFQDNRIPIVTSTEAETTVLVRSGVTIIIGGLIETKDTLTDNRLPILGSIPIIGFAFRGITDRKTKKEIVIFLTPQIVNPDGSIATFPPVAAAAPDLPTVALDQPVPSGYRHLVRQRLQQHLVNQFLAHALPGGSAVVSFVLSHDGRLVRPHNNITSPQGDSFILAATGALNQAEPFPPFPEGSEVSEVRFRMAVEYTP